MTNRSKKYFAIKWAEKELKKFKAILDYDKVIWDYFFHVPIPGSADMSRLENLESLNNIKSYESDENGLWKWEIPAYMFPIITEVPTI